MADLRNEDWDSSIQLNDVNEASIWTKTFLDIADKHAPMKQSRVKGNDLPWMSSPLKDISFMNKIAFTAKLSNRKILLIG